MRNIAAFWNSLPGWAKGVLLLIIIVALYFVLWKPIKAALDKQKVKNRLKDIGESVVEINDGTTLNLSAVASAIYDAFYNYMLGTMEDEERAIKELKRVPQEYIQQLEHIYNDLHGESLQDDFVELVSADEWESIKYLFN